MKYVACGIMGSVWVHVQSSISQIGLLLPVQDEAVPWLELCKNTDHKAVVFVTCECLFVFAFS
jgi:hypothetical protein